jgi:hypothetical protein
MTEIARVKADGV